jgi:hypothetical protein
MEVASNPSLQDHSITKYNPKAVLSIAGLFHL